MKQFLTIIWMLTLMLSCRRSENKDINEEFPKPTEKCKNISFDDQRPIKTYGFNPENYESVKVESFVKNSRFDTLIHSYKIKLSPISSDTRKVRYLTISKETTTDVDIQITFNDTLKYKITDIQTEWVPIRCEALCGYTCRIVSYKVNDEEFWHWNIIIIAPNFTRPTKFRTSPIDDF